MSGSPGAPQASPDRPSRRTAPLARLLLALAAAAAVVVLLARGLDLIQDRQGVEAFLGEAFQRLGIRNDAVSLTEGGLTALSGKLTLAAIALVIGVGGAWGVYWAANNLVAQLPDRWRDRAVPFVFVGPAIVLLAIYLIFPAFNTIATSLTEDVLGIPEEVPDRHRASGRIAADFVAGETDLSFSGYLLDAGEVELARVRDGERAALILIRPGRAEAEGGEPGEVLTATAIGLRNYEFAFTSDDMRVAFRNNVLWLAVCTSVSVFLGLVIAAMVDRVRYESTAKSFIFMPLAISFVGASVIWRFVYAWQPPGRAQIGLLNAVVTALGGEPVPWVVEDPLNTFGLIAIMIWLQTGLCMIVLSAALKGIPHEILEAARIDGAGEVAVFLRITVPSIRGSILTVGTTVFIATLKVFDIVYVMTGGRFDTEVIANRMFVEMFTFRNFGRASSLALILLFVVVPIMVVNVRNLRRQGINE
jgi:alpha-glucoside transport system permease protein